MTAENASRPLRLRDKAGRDAFFAEYERLVLQGCEINVSPDLALDIFNRLNETPSTLTPFEDVIPTLITLRERGLTLGLISNINLQGKNLIDHLGLADHVDFAVTSAEMRVEKPPPLAFRTALDRANVTPAQAMMVGDQPDSDIAGAHRVGIAPVLIDRGGNYPQYDAFPRISTLEQLPPLIA